MVLERLATTSGINDGVAFLLIASEEFIRNNNIKPLAEIVDSSVVGINSQVRGLAPAYAIKQLFNKANMSFNDGDYYEINEAFAAQALGTMRILQEEYKITKDEVIEKTNMYGSGLGLGHLLGCTGARITTTLSYILKNKNARYGIATLCIDGGMGEAFLLRKVDENEF